MTNVNSWQRSRLQKLVNLITFMTHDGSAPRIRLLKAGNDANRAAIRLEGSIAPWSDRGNVLRPVSDLYCPQTPSALTSGILAIGGTLKASQALTEAASTLLAAGLTANVDVPRTIRFTASSGCGDGTFGGKLVTVTGYNQFGESISETVALNAATAVETIQAFSQIVSIALPGWNADGDVVNVLAGSSLGLYRPVASSAQVLEMSRKASAAAEYTAEALPTINVGQAYGTLKTALTKTGTSIEILDSAITGTFPTAPFLVEVVKANGETELMRVSAKNSAGGTTTLTIAARGLHGETAGAYSVGTMVRLKAPMTVTLSAITANDRIRVDYLAGVA